jgi:two-component system response regulator AdeR
MTPDRAGTILVVEDDEVVAETLTLYLTHAGYAVERVVCLMMTPRGVQDPQVYTPERVADGRAGVTRASDPAVALVILDWMIPGLNGQEVCRQVRSRSTVPILMLTARTSEADRVRGLQTGADDYVPKPFSPREVVARVEALLRRARPAAGASVPAPLRIGRLEVDGFRREARLDGRAVALTPTEFRLLETLARHPGRTFTRDELIARTFGPDYDGLDRTVDTHVTHLRRKLAASGGTGFVTTVHGLGYRLGVPGP